MSIIRVTWKLEIKQELNMFQTMSRDTGHVCAHNIRVYESVITR